MDQPRKVAKPARGQLNREIKVSLQMHPVISTYRYVLQFALVYIPGIFFIWGHMHIRARLIHCCIIYIICDHSAVCIYVYMYGHHISTG